MPKPKLEPYHVVLTTPQTSPGKHSLTVVEMQQVQHIVANDFEEEISCLKCTINNGRKVCVNFKTDAD